MTLEPFDEILVPMTEAPVKKKKDKHLPADPLHGVTLEKILNDLVENYGWKEMGETVRVKCFNVDPSVKSSLTFLRRTPWARNKVERMYIRFLRAQAKKKLKKTTENLIVKTQP